MKGRKEVSPEGRREKRVHTKKRGTTKREKKVEKETTQRRRDKGIAGREKERTNKRKGR